MTEQNGLAELEAVLARDFAFFNHPAANWVAPRQTPDGAPLLDVLIVGGGTCGVTAAFHLKRMGIHNIAIIDAAAKGLQGPWRTFARMETLRSPKHLTGPASGLTNLTFRAWHEAKFGTAAWDGLGYIAREMWADYLDWFTHATGAEIRYETALRSLRRDGRWWSADVAEAGGPAATLHARHVVLATGRDALSRPRVPPPFAPFLGQGVYHTGDAPDRSLMHGQRVAVIGLGASAFDYAAEALEGGARDVVILGRSAALARVNKAKQIVYAGFTHGFPLLADDEKLAILEHIFAHGIAPPRGTVQRVMRHANVTLELDAGIFDVARDGDAFRLRAERGVFTADTIVLGTGYRVDLDAAPFLGGLATAMRRWRDVTGGRTSAGELLDFPYLGQGFEFLARSGQPTRLDGLYCFNHAAMVSLGNLANDIPAVSEGADRLARTIASALFLEDRETHFQRLHDYVEPELCGDEVADLEKWWPPLG